VTDKLKRLLDAESMTTKRLADLLRAATPPAPTEADEETIEARVNDTIAGLRDEATPDAGPMRRSGRS
jgi:hypothetical protein